MSFQKSNNSCNAGGISKMWLLNLNHFKMPYFNPQTGLFVWDIDSLNLEEIYFTLDTGKYKVVSKEGVYQIEIVANHPRNRPDLWYSIQEKMVTPFVLLVKDNNGNFLLFGNHDNYFLMDFVQDSGADWADFNHFELKLKRLMMCLPVFVQDPFIAVKLEGIDVTFPFKLGKFDFKKVEEILVFSHPNSFSTMEAFNIPLGLIGFNEIPKKPVRVIFDFRVDNLIHFTNLKMGLWNYDSNIIKSRKMDLSTGYQTYDHFLYDDWDIENDSIRVSLVKDEWYEKASISSGVVEIKNFRVLSEG